MQSSVNGTRKISKDFALPVEFERGLLHGMMQGLVPLDTVQREELSREGAMVWDGLSSLANATPPFSMSSVVSAMVDIRGYQRAECTEIVKGVLAQKIGAEGTEIIDALRDKQALWDLINAANEQLRVGRMDQGELLAAMETSKRSTKLVPAATYLKDGIPPDPTGMKLPWPEVNKATGGLIGMWAIGGEGGTGKSTLALQLAATYAADGGKVLYYDFENGLQVMLNHLGHAFKNRTTQLIDACGRIYFRDSIRTLNDDLREIGGPCLVVVDSVQKLPTQVQHRRAGLDQWIVKFESLKKKGHNVILLSEKNRASAGEARQSGFKETSEIEYSADMGAQILEIDEGVIEFHIVKNRHRKNKGFITTLVWEDWKYVEAEYDGNTEDPSPDRRKNAWQD